MKKRKQQLTGFIFGIFLFAGAILPVTSFAQDYENSRFGFLSVYGQSRPTQYRIWDEEFGLDLIAESSILVEDLSIGWTRISFWYTLIPDNYNQQKFDQAKKDGLEFFATVIIEESDFNEISYSEWLKEIISKYSSDVKYWQIHNEVGKKDRYENPDDYLELVRVTSSVIKESCDDCIIVMGSTIPNEEYYDVVIQKGDSCVDAYDFHIFSEDGMDTFKKFETKTTKPIFITEMSTYSGKPLGRQTFTYQTEKQQAEILIKWYTQSFYHGADYIFWSQFIEWYKFGGQVDGFFDFTGIVYNGMCDCPDPNNICDDLSIDKGALVKKEAYYSLQTIIDKIDGFSSVEKINKGQFKFKVDKKEVYILWCDSGSCSLPSEISGEVIVTDYLGDEKTMSISQIILGKSPVFFRKNIKYFN